MEAPIVKDDMTPTFPWWRFFQGLLNRTAASVPALVEDSITAAGTTQDTATALNSEWNYVSTTPANSGVLLYDFGSGVSSIVWNGGVNSLKVYPPVGASINGGSADAPYALAAGKTQLFFQLSPVDFRTVTL